MTTLREYELSATESDSLCRLAGTIYEAHSAAGRYFHITGAERAVDLLADFLSGRIYCIAIAMHE
jgi:hypothetical protein